MKINWSFKRIKSWLDYGMLHNSSCSNCSTRWATKCVTEHIEKYHYRRDVLIEAFKEAGWEMNTPNASMFIWAKIPEKARHLGSMEFSKQLLTEAKVAVSPGIGFGHYGDEYVRIALIENEKRIRQAAKKY